MFRQYRDDEPSADAPSTEEMEYRKTFYPANLANHDLIVWVVEHLKDAPGGIPRDDGKPTDAIVVDVVDLSRPDPTNRYWGAMAQGMWWRAGTVIGKLRPFVGGEPILVRLTSSLIPGSKYKTFNFVDMSADANVTAKAQSWLQWNPGYQPTRPGPQQPTAAAPGPASPGAPGTSHAGNYSGVSQTAPSGPPPATPLSPGFYQPPVSPPPVPTYQAPGSYPPAPAAPGTVPFPPGPGYGPAGTAGPGLPSPSAGFEPTGPAIGTPQGWQSQPPAQPAYFPDYAQPQYQAAPLSVTPPGQFPHEFYSPVSGSAPVATSPLPPPPPSLPPPNVDPAFRDATLDRLRRAHQAGPYAPNPQIDPALQADEPPF
jgi:hypothetical protein